jgi:hypothetical protein
VDGARVDLSPPARAEVKKKWSYTCIHSIVFVAWRGTTLSSLPFLENWIMRDYTLKCCSVKCNLTECENHYIKYISR